jgi:hypothetical protein
MQDKYQDLANIIIIPSNHHLLSLVANSNIKDSYQPTVREKSLYRLRINLADFNGTLG